MKRLVRGCAIRTRDRNGVPRGGKLEVREDTISNCISTVQKDYYILVEKQERSV